MGRRALNRPTDSETAILSVLWRLGPSNVRAVHDALKDARKTGYTTVLKLMQLMLDKKLLERDTSTRPHVYRPAMAMEQTQGHLVRDLVDRAFAGSSSQLVARALSTEAASLDELQEIEQLLQDALIQRRAKDKG